MVANNAKEFLEHLTTNSAFRAEFKTSAAGKVPAILISGNIGIWHKLGHALVFGQQSGIPSTSGRFKVA